MVWPEAFRYLKQTGGLSRLRIDKVTRHLLKATTLPQLRRINHRPWRCREWRSSPAFESALTDALILIAIGLMWRKRWSWWRRMADGLIADP